MWYKYSQQAILPPVHEGCHCYIETLPSGNTIWQFSGNTCDTCKTLAREYNSRQNSIINEPAQIDPVIPAPPAIMEEPTEAPIEEEPLGVETNTQPMLFRNLRYTPKKFYNL
jgi:hypothetical protein